VLFDELTTLLKYEIAGDWDQAVDVGCGSGQFTTGLSSHFKQVIGIDYSESQISESTKDNKHDNVTFKVGSFDSFPDVADKSCELVTSMLAAHWFDPIAKFYTEADRVLKPGGCLVVGGYGLPSVHYGDGKLNDELHVIYKEFYDDVGKYKLPGNLHVENHYEGWELPYEDNNRCDDLCIIKMMTLQDFVGYLKSYSFYGTYVQNHPDKPDPAEEYCKGVLQELKTDKTPDNIEIQVMWRIFYLVGKKPQA